MAITKISMYLSHPIRGANGPDATAEEKAENNRVAQGLGRTIRSTVAKHIKASEDLCNIEFDLYVPADHDEVINYLFCSGHIEEHHILEADCQIIDRCRAVLAYCPDGICSSGMHVELKHAGESGKHIIKFQTFDRDVARKIINLIRLFATKGVQYGSTK